MEPDETVTLTLTDAWGSLNGIGHYGVDGSDGTVAILPAPEFISDTDKSQGITKDNILENDNGRKQTVNGDSYAAYVKRNAEKDDDVLTVTDIFAASNRGVQYRFAKTDSYGNVLRDTQGRPYMSISAGGADENLFVINSETGEISTNKSFKDETHLEATYRFTIIAFDPDETRLCDEAQVTITLTQWNVARDGDVAADVVSSAGCTLAELADEIELNASEFKEWLYSKNEYVQLIDGTQIHKDNLSVTDILAANQQFEIPNTIVMAWFGEMGIAGQGWMLWLKNKSDLQALGFHVLVFNNDTYDDWLQPETMAAEAKGDFKHLLNNLSKSQFLHGLYMMGHGSPSSIGSSGTNVFTYGPEWSILYNSDRIGDNSDSIGGQIKYHLGAVIIHACHSNDFGNTAASLKSGKGLFVGQEGVYVPIIGVERIATHWGEVLADIGEGDLYYLYGGRQRTDQIIGSEF